MLIDLHTHTRPFSWDSDLSADELVEAARRAGLDGVCISEHDYVWNPDDIAALAKRHDFLVLPAVEVDTEYSHVLCYGLDRYVYGMHRFEVLAAEVRARGGAMIAAHPYRKHLGDRAADNRDALDFAAESALFSACDAIEGWNGRGSTRENTFSARLGASLDKPMTGGSDSHRLSDIARCATEFSKRIETIADLVEELRAGQFRPVRLVAEAAKA